MKPLALIAAILLLTGIGHAEPAEMPASRDVIEDFVAAYNAKDLDGMMALAHPDIEWIAIDGSESEVFSAGTAALAEEMTGHFSSATFPHSELSNWSVNDDFVAVTETARWTGADGEEKAQSSIAVYQLEEGLIRRVWYYPSR
ncbi:nuclear transport factor 2 family protein [Parvularcula marina]|uniref:nuclear transport factor 2 family protein n=1 Tax=Parvularcula marina TaxID=2292771 RepID=UPI003513909A